MAKTLFERVTSLVVPSDPEQHKTALKDTREYWGRLRYSSMATQATYTLVSPPTPGLDPPPGVIPTFHQPYTLQPYVELTISLAIIITTMLMVARIYVKVRIVKKLLIEDYLCIIGWISNIGDLFVCVAYGTIKVSILLLIIRIFLNVKRNMLYWFTVFLTFANGAYYFAAFFVNIFSCSPRHKIWDPETPGKCLNVDALYISSATFNTFSDVAMLAVPLIMVWKLQMSRQRKFGISAIFGTGAFATACAVARVKFQVKLLHSKDFTFVHTQTGLLGYGEVGCGVICCCLPLLPLFWHSLSHSSGSGHINLDDMDKSAKNLQTNRSVHEAYNPDNGVKAGSWVRLEDGTAHPVPKVHGLARGSSEERAVHEAIVGNSKV
ncbi:hypothetical protein G7Y79_00008g024310 [Physcia stellaris]|nr:hypothetical protein G7Y79_00008g024310 [Physcia stellaris]